MLSAVHGGVALLIHTRDLTCQRATESSTDCQHDLACIRVVNDTQHLHCGIVA